jgi:hypothetical protein
LIKKKIEKYRRENKKWGLEGKSKYKKSIRRKISIKKLKTN